MDPTIVNQIEVLLVGRALLYAFVFLVIAWIAFTTNTHNKPAVKIAGIVSAILCAVNIVIAIEWIALFYV